MKLAQEVLDEKIAVINLGLGACQAGSPGVAKTQDNFFGANADPAVQIVIGQAGGGSRAARRSERGGGWLVMWFLRGDAKRWGDRGLSCLGDDHPAVGRRATVNGRKANFATMKRR